MILNTLSKLNMFIDKKEPKHSLSKRALIHKKFVEGKTLILIFIISIIYVIFHTLWIKHLPLYLIILIELPMLVIVWHKAYQFLYDLKLILFFSDEYDVKAEPRRKKKLPTITFIIPSYQEPFNVAKMTFDSIVNAPYGARKEVIVADNSRDTISEDFLKWKAYVENFNTNYPNENLTATFLYNEEKDKLKPGNLDLAQKSIKEGEFVVFLDVDSTLPDIGSLLERAVAEFEADSNLGFIQFRIKATNDYFNSLTHAVAVSQNLLRLRMLCRGYGGYKIFEGHNGIWRKTVLDENGPWTEYYRGDVIITEDILKTVHMYDKGYYGKPLNIETGEWVPTSLKSLEGMWIRWMYGNSQVFFKCFKKLYSKNTSLIEKFDVSHHILHHLVTVLVFLVSFVLQWFVSGPMTNIFIFSMCIFPQIIAATTSYFTYGRKFNQPLTKKLQNLYAGFFIVETFVMCAQLKSDIKFALGIRQGWKVTEKGVENAVSWKNLIHNNSFAIIMSLLSIGIGVISWIINYNMAFTSLFHHFALFFVNINLLLCILIYGKQGRKSHNCVDSVIHNNTVLQNSFKPEFIKVEV